MLDLVPIGVARTPFPRRNGIPRQGAGPARIELNPRFVPALVGIERSSHLWIISWFHLAERHILQTKSRRALPNQPRHGVLGMRTPVRPNPIGLSAARLLRIDGSVLLLDRLDLMDGTPVLDIKPYTPGWDMIPAATASHRYRKAQYTPSELREALTRDATQAIGQSALESKRVTSALTAFQSLVMEHDVDLRSPGVRFALPSLDELVDVLLCVAGATFGNRRLALDETIPHGAVFDVISPDGRQRFWMDGSHGDEQQLPAMG